MIIVSDLTLDHLQPYSEGLNPFLMDDVCDAPVNTGSGKGSGIVIEGSGYRYGFNGKENDNEVKEEGNQQDYGMRIYDPRVGRFLSFDPLTKEYPELTPYQFASNRPLDGIDLDGKEWSKQVTIDNKSKTIVTEYSI
ncbi:MAG: hypothetical protein ICV65_06805 [Flavisolibacter sp.]|nr:hypothetical protein [Flavisolibacter sp.]